MHQREARAIELDDGRTLAWEEYGPADGAAIMFFHGTPSSRRALRRDAALLDAHQARVIAVDRPGYGLSTFQPRRRLDGWAGDVRHLADHLGLERFGVIGHSGGGPHALVCARFLGDRVGVAVTVGGFCPLGPKGKRAPAESIGMVATRAPWAATAVFRLTFATHHRWPEQSVRMTTRMLPAADREVLRDPEAQAEYMTASSPTAAEAAAQDLALMVGDWGFKLKDIVVPVHAWHGTEDFNVPFAHSEYVTGEIAGAQLHRVDGAGHLIMSSQLKDILAVAMDELGATDTSRHRPS
jgi:pimeloyl-ACP methyl ester carboxylesterase